MAELSCERNVALADEDVNSESRAVGVLRGDGNLYE
jgi:hypothetical protein